jgi:hypothetical protein
VFDEAVVSEPTSEQSAKLKARDSQTMLRDLFGASQPAVAGWK